MSETRIRIGLQKSGRMAEDSTRLLEACGLHMARSKDQLFCRIKELPVDVLLLRDDDIPHFVADGVCDLGIVGENVYAEVLALQNDDLSATVVTKLGFSQCRLSISVPETFVFDTAQSLNGLTIATSYPELLKTYLATENIAAKILLMKGAVEVAPRLKIADAICDIVASGATLAANNLKEVALILQSEALLIRAAQKLTPEKEEIIARLVARMRGSLRAQDSKYIMLHADKESLADIIRYLPGAEAPTILPLSGSDNKFAVHAVCREAVFWETMEKLQAAGASAVLVLPIEKMLAEAV